MVNIMPAIFVLLYNFETEDLSDGLNFTRGPDLSKPMYETEIYFQFSVMVKLGGERYINSKCYICEDSGKF